MMRHTLRQTWLTAYGEQRQGQAQRFGDRSERKFTETG